MKSATKKTVTAALAVALAGMGLPAAALAANAADETAGTAVAETASDVLVVDWSAFDSANVSDYEGKWFRIDDGEGGSWNGEDSTVKFKYQRDGSKMSFWVDGEGYAGTGFPINDAMCTWRYDQRGHEFGTLRIGAGITRIGSDMSGVYVGTSVTVKFEEGSQLTYLGRCAFEGAKSVNLEACTKLKKLDSFSVAGVEKPVTIPSSVEEVVGGALNATDFTLEDAENTPLPSSLSGVTVISAPTVKATGSNKVTVSWGKPYKGKWTTTVTGGKHSKTYVTYPVKYKLQYRVKGDEIWKKTSMTSAKSKTLTKLTKGMKYQVRVTAYKKSGSKWKALTTSTCKTVKVS